MPTIPYLVSGTVSNSNGNLLSNALIYFYSASGSSNTTTNSKGQYTIDLASIGYTNGETIRYAAYDQFENEKYSGTFAITGGSKTINISLSIIKDAVVVRSNRDTQIYNIGGKPVSQDNPFPIINQNLPENYDSVWVITREDFQPDTETITLNGSTYKRTFGYTNNVMTTRSRWVKQ